MFALFTMLTSGRVDASSGNVYTVTMQKKTTAVRLSPSTRGAIEDWAQQERRTVSAFLQILIDDYVSERKRREAQEKK